MVYGVVSGTVCRPVFVGLCAALYAGGYPGECRVSPFCVTYKHRCIKTAGSRGITGMDMKDGTAGLWVIALPERG